MLELKPDTEDALRRFDAWWDCDIIDRTLTHIVFSKPPDERVAVPEKSHETVRDRWMDTEYVVDRIVAGMVNAVHYADALPSIYPNLGPELFSAFYGCPLEFSESTSWSVPVLEDWSPESVATLKLDRNNEYYRKILELSDALCDAARGKFIVGYTDLHGGADAIAAFRDPEKLCIDMIEYPREIKALCDRITKEYLDVYDEYYERLTAAGMLSTSWIPATCQGKFYIPSNDFSCMISADMFRDVFLPGIVEECRHMDRSIYHLDGPQALVHLDALLSVPEIHAIQWVAGSGYDYWADWLHVYRRIQDAGKALVLYLDAEDLPRLFESLKPEGVWVWVRGVRDREEADEVLKSIERWGK